MPRLDKRGRRIGYNWWREYIMEMYAPARQAWEDRFEAETNMTYHRGIIATERRAERRGGRREVTDFIEVDYPPTLKEYLLANAGMHQDRSDYV